jgi:hypothetical protein
MLATLHSCFRQLSILPSTAQVCYASTLLTIAPAFGAMPKSTNQTYRGKPACTNEHQITPAETALKQEATKPQYSLTLLTIVSSDSLPVNTRLGAALAFKNFIRINYVVSDNATPPTRSTPTRLRHIIFKILRLAHVGRGWKLQDPPGRGPNDQRAPHRADDRFTCQHSEPAG